MRHSTNQTLVETLRQALSGLIEKTFREEHGCVLTALISQLGDFELAEDVLINVLERWEFAPRAYLQQWLDEVKRE